MFDNKTFLVALGRLATEQSGRVYVPTEPDGDTKPCTYALYGQPDCIIGHALYEAGVPVEQLEWFDTWDDATAQRVLSRLGAHPSVAHFAELVQNRQDRGMSWGDAYREAKESTITPQAMLTGVHDG